MNLITIGIIISAAITIGLVLIQDRSSGTGGAFGGGEGSIYQTRRGVEKFVFIATIVSVIAFSSLSIVKTLEICFISKLKFPISFDLLNSSHSSSLFLEI